MAANKQDAPDALPLDYIQMRLGLPASIPVLPCIARDIASVHAVLYALLDRVEALASSHPHEGASPVEALASSHAHESASQAA